MSREIISKRDRLPFGFKDGPQRMEPGDRDTVQTLNLRGQWVESIPEPMWVGWRERKCRCGCTKVFKDRRTYRGHYALVHIMGLN